MTFTRWFPELVTWLFNNSSNPGMQRLRQNKEEAHIVARKLFDSKKQELKDGVPRKDIMILLGLLFPLFYFFSCGC